MVYLPTAFVAAILSIWMRRISSARTLLAFEVLYRQKNGFCFSPHRLNNDSLILNLVNKANIGPSVCGKSPPEVVCSYRRSD